MVATDGTIATLLDTSRSPADRLAAAAALRDDNRPAVIEALTRVAQQVDVPPALATQVGITLGHLCFARAQDVHELDLAMFSDNAADAYDREIGRLQREFPDVVMRRAGVGSES
jgi:hypothetical protein